MEYRIKIEESSLRLGSRMDIETTTFRSVDSQEQPQWELPVGVYRAKDIVRETSALLETVMILLVLATIAWGIYRLYRIHRSNKAMTSGKWIVSLAGGLLPVLILLFLSPLATFIGAGRVLPWYGLWTAMSSLIIWLVVLSLVNITVMVCRFRLYYQTKKMKGITTSPYPGNPSR